MASILGGIVWSLGPDYTYFDLPVVSIGGVRRAVFNRWTMPAAMALVALLCFAYLAYAAQPAPAGDRIVWGKSVDPTLWAHDGSSPSKVTLDLLEHRPEPDVRARGTSPQLPTVTKVPAGQSVVVAARYRSGGGYEMADKYGVFNDLCSVVPGGTVRVIGQHHNQVLVGYSPPLRSPKTDKACTNKEVFYLEVASN